MKTKSKFDPLQPPEGLSDLARSWWRWLFQNFELDCGASPIVEVALRSLDRMQEARKMLDRDGITTTDRWGQLRPHPALSAERDSKLCLLRAWKALNLDLDPPANPPGWPVGPEHPKRREVQ